MAKSYKQKTSDSNYTQSKKGRKGGEQTQENQGMKVNPMAAATAGAIVGAAAGAVAGAVLSNEKTRKQVGDAFQTMRHRAMDSVQKMSDKGKTESPLEGVKQKVKGKVEETKE